ncbi:uncharacterized protein LOC111022106 [Momordica charantia]|uniref:Uncharacterized protein LOC111022106 n=1 Tax=Momordica charantia TaxID=3673 RepID=A0A6J1DN39_MOMCH|nr:uncharacterized protein LOC111022106 [Momordica charantia]
MTKLGSPVKKHFDLLEGIQLRHTVYYQLMRVSGLYSISVGCRWGPPNQIYPVAFAIVDGETVASWVWFMTQLKGVFGVVKNLVFVSDRHQTICKAIDKVFPTAFHCFCIQHIKMNLLAKFKVDAKALEEIFLKAAKAYQESYFNSIWAQLGAYPGVREYLDDIGKERWARCFQTFLRYTQMTTWFYDRQMLASSRSTTLSDYAENKFAEYSDSARRYVVVNIDQFHVQVRDGNLDGIVDFNSRTCSCREFDYYKIPCSHAIVGAKMRNINPYTLCDEAYTTNS